VNERDGDPCTTLSCCSMPTQADQRRRKISPTYHERMVWARATARVCAPSTARSAHWSARVLGALQPLAHIRDDGRRRADPLGECIRARSSATCFPSRRRSTSGSMRWSLRVLSSAPRRGSTPTSRRTSSRTRAAPLARSRAAARRSWHRIAPCCASRSLGEGIVIADLDFTLIEKRKQMMDSRGHLQPARVTESPDRSYAHRARSRTRCASMSTALSTRRKGCARRGR